MHRGRWPAVLIICLAAGCTFLSGPELTEESTTAMLEEWISAMDGANDERGWQFVHATAQEHHWSGDQAEYAATVGAVDWSRLDWSVEFFHPVDDFNREWSVSVRVASGREALIPALYQRGILSAYCVDSDWRGFHVFIGTAQDPFTIGAGAGADEEDTGACPEEAPPPPDQFEPGNGMRWTGHQLEVWNWTEAPLFIVDQQGWRIDLAPCSKTGIDRLGLQYEIRGAPGYVGTFGWSPVAGVTTYVVIGSEDVHLNNAPPAAPILRCEGTPFFQPGV